MRKSLKLSAVIAAALPLALLGTTSPANASTVAGGLIQGGGVISPALTPTGTGGSHYSFNGTVTGLDATIAANGDDSIGSLALGEGSVHLTAPITGEGVFVRAGAVVLAVVADASGPGAAAGVFAFLPDPIAVGNVGAYTLLGVGGGLDLA